MAGSSSENTANAPLGEVLDLTKWSTKDSMKRYKQMGEGFPFAYVVWWDQSSAYILCPYCGLIHHHDCGHPTYYDLAPQNAHCGVYVELKLKYTLLFPFSEHPEALKLGLSYEIDKGRKRFRTVGIDVQEAVDLSVNDLADALHFAALNKSDENAVPPSPTHSEDFDKFVAECTTKNLLFAEEILDASPDQHQLLHGRDINGDTALSLVSSKDCPSVVQFLIDEGSSVNTINKAGRTPLMEAALWARAAVAQHLLRAGAVTDVKDRHGRTALDLARENQLNEDERAHRSSVYVDDRDKRQQRRIIIALLGGAVIEQKKPNGIALADIPATRFYKWHLSEQLRSIALLQPVVQIPVEHFHKTVAFLSRGPHFPIIRAKSGWSDHGAESEHLSNIFWTSEVMRISQLVGYELEKDRRLDRGVPGRYSACHAEKQLMAFFLMKHYFITKELVSDRELAELAATNPPWKPPVVTILVNKKVCDDCEGFRRLLERLTRAQINIEHVETVA